MKKRFWILILSLLLLGLGLYYSLHRPIDYSLVEPDNLPNDVLNSFTTSSQHPSFTLSQHGKDLYVMYHYPDSTDYQKVTLTAHRKFSNPVVTAVINHAVNESEVQATYVVKLSNVSAKDVQLVVKDKR